MFPEAVAQHPPQIGMAAQGVPQQALRGGQQLLVDRAGQIRMAGQQLGDPLPATLRQPLCGDLGADEADLLALGRGPLAGRRGAVLGADPAG